MRIAIVAEHASTQFGGEAILPYHYFRLLRARGVEAWLVVHARTREEISSRFPHDLDRIRFVEDMELQKLLYRLSRRLPRRISEATLELANQFVTQWRQRGLVRALVAEQGIELLHQPMPVSPRFPSLLWDLGVPLVAGPLNGGMEYPPAFRRAESWLSHTAIRLGRGCASMVNRMLPGKLRAAVVIVANRRTREALPAGVRGRIVEFPENGVDLAHWTAATPAAPRDATPRFLFIGRLVEFKALEIAIHAVHAAPGARLDVIGSGPMEAAWKRLVAKLGLEDRVRFLGQQSQEVCALHLGNALALVLPSVYECGGAVVLEAMAMGKPVIATAWGGPADYLDAECGILIPPNSRAWLIEGFARAMRDLAKNPDRCQRLGAAGQRKVIALYGWDKKIDQMLTIYASALTTRTRAQAAPGPSPVASSPVASSSVRPHAGRAAWRAAFHIAPLLARLTKKLSPRTKPWPEAKQWPSPTPPQPAAPAVAPAPARAARPRQASGERSRPAPPAIAAAARRETRSFEAVQMPRIAYLMSRYPAVSHTFFLHEVLGLRARGLQIETASINPPDRPAEKLPPIDAIEAQDTFYLKGLRAGTAMLDILHTAVVNPAVVLRGLDAVLSLSGLTLRQRLYWLFYLGEAILLGRWMKQRKLNHLHVHFGGAVASVGMLTAAAWRIPYSLTIHGPEELLNVDAYQLREKTRRARFVLCISDFCRSQLFHFTPVAEWRKFQVVRLGVDPMVLVPYERAPSEQAVEIVCTGRLVPAKGHQILLQALLMLHRQGLPIHATFIGAGPELRSLQRFVAHHGLAGVVTFTSALSHQATLDHVRRAHIFALASFAEGIPVALMEAMALGVPCVGTMIAGIPELIRHEVDGLLVPPANAPALADSLRLLIEDPVLRRSLGEAGRERIISHYNLPLNQELLARTFERELHRAKPTPIGARLAMNPAPAERSTS